MRTRTLLTAAFTAVFLAGCIVTSLHPLFTKEDCVFDPKLVGRWVNPEDAKAPVWIFKARDDKRYDCTIIEKGKQYRFLASLGHLGDSPMLDLLIKRPDEETFSGMHLLPTHSFLKLALKGNSLTLRPLNYEWIEKKVKAKELDIAYAVLDNERIILTEKTKKLQKFILDHENDEGAFGEANTWHRREKK